MAICGGRSLLARGRGAGCGHADLFSDNVSQYDVGAGGELTPGSPPTVSAGAEPLGLAVSPDGRSVYVANQAGDNVSQYDVGASGQLVPKTPAAVAAGSIPVGVAVSPAPARARRPGKGCGDRNHVHDRRADCKKPPP